MNRELAKKVADAVLYEGYMLYPYRPSAVKNRQRWTFGILYPPAYEEVRLGTERNRLHSEFLLQATGSTAVQLQLRFLHLVSRQVSRRVSELDAAISDAGKSEVAGSDAATSNFDSYQTDELRFAPVPSLLVGDRMIESWDEAIERSVEFEFTPAVTQHSHSFSFPGSEQAELLHDPAGQIIGQLSRTQHSIAGTISASTQPIHPGVLKLSIDITNTAPDFDSPGRNAALLRSLVSAHTILTAADGEFISLLDPPAELRDAVKACSNIGNFPVLVGQEPERDMLLCSPIVLYDFPQIAPESASDFYDATEMDEMLTLRVMTLTDDEKNEMRLADDHVRNLLQRTEESAREQLARTHGVIRSLRPVGEKS